MSKNEGITLRCTAAFTLNGDIVRPGDLVELTRTEAANLLHRGRVEIIDGDQAAEPAAEAPKVARGKASRKPGKNVNVIGAEAAAEAADADQGDAD
jgi:hypothetical protein